MHIFFQGHFITNKRNKCFSMFEKEMGGSHDLKVIYSSQV